jgi:hypothetical protein
MRISMNIPPTPLEVCAPHPVALVPAPKLMTTPGIRATYFVADKIVAQEIGMHLPQVIYNGQAIALYSTQQVENCDV